jgi:hypothetical protein
MPLPCVLFRSACCNRKKMEGHDGPPPFLAKFVAGGGRGGGPRCRPPYGFFECLLRGGAKHPLTSFVRRWFRLSFCTPFLALHSSARNHATRFSMFFSSSKRFSSITTSEPLLGATHDLPCRNCSSTHWHSVRH